jgi:hypothetical protein
MGNAEKGILLDSFQQPLFKNEGLKVPEESNWVTGLFITNADNLSILRWKVNGGGFGNTRRSAGI